MHDVTRMILINIHLQNLIHFQLYVTTVKYCTKTAIIFSVRFYFSFSPTKDQNFQCIRELGKNYTFFTFLFFFSTKKCRSVIAVHGINLTIIQLSIINKYKYYKNELCAITTVAEITVNSVYILHGNDVLERVTDNQKHEEKPI